MGFCSGEKGRSVMDRFFALTKEGDRFTFSSEDLHHMKQVLRKKEGDEIEVVFGERVYRGFLKESEEGFQALEGELISQGEQGVFLTLYQGIPKGSKMEEIIKHGTEVGVDAFVPVAFHRCVSKISGKEEKKVSRWQKIAESAAKQGKRLFVPKVHLPMTLKEALSSIEDGKILLCYEGEKEVLLPRFFKEKTTKVHLFIGPEGGITQEEVELVRAAGGWITGLGPGILRTETAGVVASFLVKYEGGWRNERG